MYNVTCAALTTPFSKPDFCSLDTRISINCLSQDPRNKASQFCKLFALCSTIANLHVSSPDPVFFYLPNLRDANHFNILSGRIGLRIREVSIKCVQFNGSSQSKNQRGIKICAAIHTKVIQFSGRLMASLLFVLLFPRPYILPFQSVP